METMIILLEWDEEELGRGWMNIDNLGLCLYSKEHTRPDLLKVTEITNETTQPDSQEVDANGKEEKDVSVFRT